MSRTVQDFTSVGSPSATVPTFAQVIRTEIDPALTPQYEQFLRRLKSAEEQAGVGTTRRVGVQGPQSIYTAVRLFNNFTERDGWVGAAGVLADAFGEIEARTLFESQAEAVRTREIFTLRLLPALSRTP